VKSNETSTEETDDPDDEVEGLYFDKLKKLYPDHTENLDTFRAHLVHANLDKRPLRVWEVQELSLQAAERVLASGDEALKTIMHISHNFPALVG